MEYRIGTKVFTNWTIKKELGEGATGRVFEICKTDYGITTRSALKVIRVPRSASDIRAALAEGMDEQSVSSYFKGFVDEIVKEIVIMTNLKSHPNIVSYEDHHVTEHEGALGWDILIRMELLTPLYEYQLSHPMKEKDVLRMGVELTDALSFCQKKGFMHRDIKPENIFVSETGQFKLGDFGVARTVEKTTGGLSRKGTEKYMAPEVYLGRPYGLSVDIYSLGLVLYSFLNHGRLPFYPLDKKQITFADRENALGRRMKGDILPPPASASESAAEVILKACAYRSEDRYHSAAEMHEALKKILYGGQEQIEEPDVHDISEELYELESEEQTVGMVEELSAEPEEKTVGMVEMPEPEEKTVGIVESEQKTVVDLLINMPLSVQDHEVYEWLEKRHYDVQREEETAQIRVGDSETSLWTGIIECEKKRDRYIAAALRLTLEEAEESQRNEQLDYLTSTVFSQYHLNSMVESLQGDVRYVYSDNDNLFIVEYTKGVSLEVTRRMPLSVQPTGYREIGTILVNAPLQSRSDTEGWLKDNGFRYGSDKEEQITVYPDIEGAFSLCFSEYDGTVHTELFVRNTEEMYEYIKKKIQLSAGKGDIDIFTEHPNERSDENWWWVLNDRILRISFISEDKLILISIEINKSQPGDKDITEFETADESFTDNRKKLVKKGFWIAGALIALFFGCLLGVTVKDYLTDMMEQPAQEPDISYGGEAIENIGDVPKWTEDIGNPGGIDGKLLVELPLNSGADEAINWLDSIGYMYGVVDSYEDTGYKELKILDEAGSDWDISVECSDPGTPGNTYFGNISFIYKGKDQDAMLDTVRTEFEKVFAFTGETEVEEGFCSYSYTDQTNNYSINKFSGDSLTIRRSTLIEWDANKLDVGLDVFLYCPLDSEISVKDWLDEKGYSYDDSLLLIYVPAGFVSNTPNPDYGAMYTTFSVLNEDEVFESLIQQIREKTGIEGEEAETAEGRECTFNLDDRYINISVNIMAGDIYIRGGIIS